MIFLGSDHRGYEVKEKIKKYLTGLGVDFRDLGAFEYDPDDDYPDFAKAVAEAVVLDQTSRGILVCGSGIGVAVAANKIKGIRAGTAINAAQIEAAVNDEDLNILALSADYINEKEAEEIVKTFVEKKFSGEERHRRRLEKIKNLEK